jgi:hypothetical protein
MVPDRPQETVSHRQCDACREWVSRVILIPANLPGGDKRLCRSCLALRDRHLGQTVAPIE